MTKDPQSRIAKLRDAMTDEEWRQAIDSLASVGAERRNDRLYEERARSLIERLMIRLEDGRLIRAWLRDPGTHGYVRNPVTPAKPQYLWPEEER